MFKVGMTSEEIKAVNVSDLVPSEWFKEIAYQLAKLNEQTQVLIELGKTAYHLKFGHEYEE